MALGACALGHLRLELVRALRQTVGELGRQLESLVLLDLVLGNKLGKETAVHPPRHIVTRGDRKEGARVVVEADGVVEACRLRRLLAKPLHALGAVVEPPWRAQPENRIVPCQRRELARIRRLIQREKNDGQIALVAEAIEELSLIHISE